MFDTRFTGNSPSVADPIRGLCDPASAPVSFGYYQDNASDAETIARCHRPRRGPIGWWNRHRGFRAGVGLVLVGNLGFLPAVQDALLSALSHVA